MAAIIPEQVIAERDRRNQRAAQEHRRVIDTVIDKTLADRPEAAARLRRDAGAALDAKLKAGKAIPAAEDAGRARQPGPESVSEEGAGSRALGARADLRDLAVHVILILALTIQPLRLNRTMLDVVFRL